MNNRLIPLVLAPMVALQAGQPTRWVLDETDAPGMQRVLFESDVAREQVSCYVYTPDAYARESDKLFPVLYWLHGSGGSSPAAAAGVARRYGDAMRDGKMPPMLMVFPNGLPGGMWCDWKDGSVKIEQMFIRELIPHVDRTFRTVADRGGRIIEGFSMGGYGAGRLGFTYPHLFCAVSMIASGPIQAELGESARMPPGERGRLLGAVFGGDMAYFRELSPRQIAASNAPKLRAGLSIRQIVGTRDHTFTNNREFKGHLDGLSIPVEYHELPDVPHDPNLALAALGEDNWAFFRAALRRGGDGAR